MAALAAGGDAAGGERKATRGGRGPECRDEEDEKDEKERDEARRPVRHAKKGPRRMAPQPPVYSYAARRAHSSV